MKNPSHSLGEEKSVLSCICRVRPWHAIGHSLCHCNRHILHY